MTYIMKIWYGVTDLKTTRVVRLYLKPYKNGLYRIAELEDSHSPSYYGLYSSLVSEDKIKGKVYNDGNIYTIFGSNKGFIKDALRDIFKSKIEEAEKELKNLKKSEKDMENLF